jgi:hypothetical protein
LRDADGYVLGALVLEIETGEPLVIEAKTTLIATGGAARMYRTSTNAMINTGDGMAMALCARRTPRCVRSLNARSASSLRLPRRSLRIVDKLRAFHFSWNSLENKTMAKSQQSNSTKNAPAKKKAAKRGKK